MSVLVVDSSAMVNALFANGSRSVATNGPLAGHDLVAPHLIDPEVLSTMRNLVLRGETSKGDAGALLRDFRRASIEKFPHTALFDIAWGLRDNITPYDGMYVALAMKLHVPLVTTDRRLARAAAHQCEIRVLG